MSDSDEDWFNKDIDDIVQQVKEKITTNRENVDAPSGESSMMKMPPLSLDTGYGGSYGAMPKTDPNNKSKKNKNDAKSDKIYIQPISLKKLAFIADQTPLNVFLEVFQTDCGFWEVLEKNLHTEFMILVIKVFAKLCELPLHEYKKEFLVHFVEGPGVLKQLSVFLKDLINETFAKKKKKTSLILFDVTTILRETIEICKNAIRISHVNENFKKFFELIEKCIKESTNAKWASLQEQVDSISKEMRCEKMYTQEIYPTLDELTSEESLLDLKPNIVKGKYQSTNEYLQIHQTLLREDFISPLRDDILKLKKAANADEIKDRRFYKKVKFYFNKSITQKTRTAEILVVDLKSGDRELGGPEETSRVNPKDLMFGSLLCFSTSTQFDDLILATVSNRDIEMISKGYINVEIVKMYNITSIFEKDFVMIESEVYFEPYHHVHRVLRTLDEYNFPMKNFIVDVDEADYLPDYLIDSSDLLYKHRGFIFDPLEMKTFPEAHKLQLDPAQLKAYQLALSKKFSLIQGPPGTGKTYIGLEIVSTLLENVNSQVLVICYTNHALDQFLIDIIKVTKDVVRMGNQSRHEILDKYNVKQINDSIVTDRRLKACFYNTKNEYFKLIETFEALHAVNEHTDEHNKKVLDTLEKLRNISRKLEELKQISEYNFIKDKKVIAMTTTFAARSNILLKLLQTPIVVIEEAAEVLETHIIASLTKETQHVVLIGDHQQLRPATSVYKLSQKYKMDISLFERMINNNFNCVCLETQHRMRPEFADLLRPTIYKNLEDSKAVKEYENVKGILKNMFFVEHEAKETKFGDETSKRNVHEAQFLVGLANYLLQQGYYPEDIVLLTAYNGQMIQLLNERKQYPNLNKVRVTVVDNFQGEESKIILLSLVRSNDENRVGYLSVKNRVCVALSRAKEGFYVIGNMKFFAQNNAIWKSIYEELERQNCIGPSLPLQCQRHTNVTNVKFPYDFETVKFGGCLSRCYFTLPCGHVCDYMCHSDAFEHRIDCDCPKE